MQKLQEVKSKLSFSLNVHIDSPKCVHYSIRLTNWNGSQILQLTTTTGMWRYPRHCDSHTSHKQTVVTNHVIKACQIPTFEVSMNLPTSHWQKEKITARDWSWTKPHEALNLFLGSKQIPTFNLIISYKLKHNLLQSFWCKSVGHGNHVIRIHNPLSSEIMHLKHQLYTRDCQNNTYT